MSCFRMEYLTIELFTIGVFIFLGMAFHAWEKVISASRKNINSSAPTFTVGFLKNFSNSSSDISSKNSDIILNGKSLIS